MNKVTILLLSLVIISAVFVWRVLFAPSKISLTTPDVTKQDIKAEIIPSKTLKNYTDPSGFSFNYPDNLSLVSIEATSSSVYADISLTAKGIDGGLNLKIVDSKFKTLENWIKTVSAQTPTEAKLGDLKALELLANDKLLLGALDSGVLFTVETSFGDKKDFWNEVKGIVTADFSFASSQETAKSYSDEGVVFEGEEVVEI